MKNSSEPREARAPLSMRDTLFGDMPWENCLTSDKEEPWSTFARSHAAIERNDRTAAIHELSLLASKPGSESRITLQAWHFLRTLNVEAPAEIAKHVYGVVLEVAVDAGLDLLAGYEDGSARYWNYTGTGVIWETRGNAEIDATVRELLDRGQFIAGKIGPWNQARRPAPSKGTIRLNMLTPSGLHFGEGPMNIFSRDAVAGPLIHTGIKLMTLLTALHQAKR